MLEPGGSQKFPASTAASSSVRQRLNSPFASTREAVGKEQEAVLQIDQKLLGTERPEDACKPDRELHSHSWVFERDPLEEELVNLSAWTSSPFLDQVPSDSWSLPAQVSSERGSSVSRNLQDTENSTTSQDRGREQAAAVQAGIILAQAAAEVEDAGEDVATQHFDMSIADTPLREESCNGSITSTKALKADGLAHGPRSEQFQGVAQSLHDAATALRLAVGRHLPPTSPASLGTGTGPHMSSSAAQPSPGTARSLGSVPASSRLVSCQGSAERAGAVPDPVDTTPLERENASLRAELSDAMRKVAELQDERQGFYDEGIYDIVNSVCKQDTLSTSSTQARLQTRAAVPTEKDASPIWSTSRPLLSFGTAANGQDGHEGSAGAGGADSATDKSRALDCSVSASAGVEQDISEALQTLDQASGDLEAAGSDLASLLVGIDAATSHTASPGTKTDFVDDEYEVTRLRWQLHAAEAHARALAQENAKLRQNLGAIISDTAAVINDGIAARANVSSLSGTSFTSAGGDSATMCVPELVT